MKLSTSTVIIALATAGASNAAFVPHSSTVTAKSPTILKGYLDDLSADLYKKDELVDVEADSREANNMSKDQVDRFGPGNLDQFVDFDEFDGGDGQMGVAGDGTKGLDKSDFDSGALASQMNKSRSRSAKNAWGSSSGYADELTKKGVDTARAQQLENWHSQREITKMKNEQRFQAESFERVQESGEADWRTLAKFGVERNSEFDMNEAFGEATVDGGDIEGTISLNARTGAIGYHEFGLKNPYMGFADFRATLSPETSEEWTVTPTEGSLTQKEPTSFAVRYRPTTLGVSEGYMIIETEDFKKVWKLIGSTG